MKATPDSTSPFIAAALLLLGALGASACAPTVTQCLVSHPQLVVDETRGWEREAMLASLGPTGGVQTVPTANGERLPAHLMRSPGGGDGLASVGGRLASAGLEAPRLAMASPVQDSGARAVVLPRTAEGEVAATRTLEGERAVTPPKPAREVEPEVAQKRTSSDARRGQDDDDDDDDDAEADDDDDDGEEVAEGDEEDEDDGAGEGDAGEALAESDFEPHVFDRKNFSDVPWRKRPTLSRRAIEGKCSVFPDKPYIYSIGSSTMATTLGRILNKELRGWGLETRRWGKPSSGLARPDFHDWPAEIPGIVDEFEPDAFIVSLGTNDNQAVRVGKRWFRFGRNYEDWRRVYSQRVDRMLEAMSGPDRKRPVIWVGPTAFEGRRAEKIGPEVNEIIRERIVNFDGPAYFVDAFNRTVTPSGKMIQKFRIPGRRGRYKLRGPDGIHLTIKGVRWIMAEPVFDILRPCLQALSADTTHEGGDG